ncbi:hypothetical protein ABZ599_12990 [Streptomyces misionensis]|uniref:hypothetical protein n=1 Tax=Streptomyces misionensis TaxID=67331 RepID=UPI0033CA31E2
MRGHKGGTEAGAVDAVPLSHDQHPDDLPERGAVRPGGQAFEQAGLAERLHPVKPGERIEL